MDKTFICEICGASHSMEQLAFDDPHVWMELAAR